VIAQSYFANIFRAIPSSTQEICNSTAEELTARWGGLFDLGWYLHHSCEEYASMNSADVKTCPAFTLA